MKVTSGSKYKRVFSKQWTKALVMDSRPWSPYNGSRHRCTTKKGNETRRRQRHKSLPRYIGPNERQVHGLSRSCLYSLRPLRQGRWISLTGCSLMSALSLHLVSRRNVVHKSDVINLLYPLYSRLQSIFFLNCYSNFLFRIIISYLDYCTFCLH